MVDKNTSVFEKISKIKIKLDNLTGDRERHKTEIKTVKEISKEIVAVERELKSFENIDVLKIANISKELKVSIVKI